MKKFQKAIQAASALALSLLLAACGTSPAPSESKKDASQASSPASAGETAAEEDKTLKILRSYIATKEEDENAIQALSEGTGYTLEFSFLPEKNPLDKLNLMFSGGDMEYDYIMLGASDQDKSSFASYAKKGLLKDITEMIPSRANLAKVDPLCFDALKADGKIYGVGSTGLPVTKTASFIRADWLDTLQLKAPTTRDELYEVLRAFHEQDPGGNGADNIPFCASDGWVTAITSTYGIVYPYEDRDGKIVDTRTLPEFKEYLAFMNRLYSEGLLDQDMPINTGASQHEKIAAGKVGFYCGWVDDAKDLLIAKHEEKQEGSFMEAFEPLQGPDGTKKTQSDRGLFGIGMIPASSPKAEAVLDYIDTYLQPDNFESIIHGKEGVDYEIKDGVKIPTDAFNTNRGAMSGYFPLQDGDAYYDMWLLRTRKVPEYDTIYTKLAETNNPYQVSSVLAYAPSFETVSQESKSVTEYASQEMIKFIAGARDIGEFDQFVEEMNAHGSDKILDAYNEWYTAQ